MRMLRRLAAATSSFTTAVKIHGERERPKGRALN
jgi:hypothetical protein